MLRRCLSYPGAEISDLFFQLNVLLAELVNRVFQFAVLFAEGYYLTVHCCQVLDEALVFHREYIDGLLHVLKEVVPPLPLAGKGCLLQPYKEECPWPQQSLFR